MDLKMMIASVSPVMEIVSVCGETQFQRAQTLMTDKRRALVKLLSVISGKKPQEIQEQKSLETSFMLLDWFADGGLLFIQAVSSCGADFVCTVLHQYRPDDIDCLLLLLSRKRKEDRSTHYIANTLRLLVMSKMKDDIHYPTLREVLSPQNEKAPVKNGMEVLDNIIESVTGRKG